MMITDRRLGRFTLPFKMINRNPEMLASMFAQCIVVEAKPEAYSDRIEYVVIHPSFAALNPGDALPSYCPAFHTERGFIGFTCAN